LNEELILKEISIRGRFAFAMRCLELVLNKEQEINNPVVQRTLTQLWTFTESDRLDNWEEEVFAFNPSLLKVDIDEFSFPSKPEIEEIKEYYSSTTDTIRELISTIILIGTENLYAATVDFSKATLDPTLHVIKLTKSTVGQIPNIENFKKFAFADKDGWGITFDKKDVA
jgi:hypothetical protein